MKTFAIAILVLFLGGAGFMLAQKTKTPPVPPQAKVLKAWVEVLSPRVTEVNQTTNTELRELKTGDEIDSGATITVDAYGLANIYFPDGSVTRLDKGSSVTLSKAEFDQEHEKTQVLLTLNIGKLWAKVVSLVTADSSWEVETANTVVTVRGTAFGVERTDTGKSTVIGSEGKVSARRRIAVADTSTPSASTTPQNDTSPEVFVTPNTYVSVEEPTSSNGQVGKPVETELVPHILPPELARQDWVLGNKKEDQKLDAVIEKIKENTKDDRDVRKQFREQIQTQFIEAIELRRKEIQSRDVNPGRAVQQEKTELLNERETPVLKDGIPEKSGAIKIPVEKTPIAPLVKPIINNPTTQPLAQPKPIQPEAKPLDTALPIKLRLIKVSGALEITEGDPVQMRAELILSNGTVKDVTSETEWRVVGPIGTIDKPGLFRGKLAPEISEEGSGQGAIVASWKNQKNDQVFFDKSPIIRVNLKIETETGQAI